MSAVPAWSPLLLPGVRPSLALPARHYLVNEAALPWCNCSAEHEHPSRANTCTRSTSEWLVGSRNINRVITRADLAQPLPIASSNPPLCLPDPPAGILVWKTAPKSVSWGRRGARRERTLQEPCCLQRDQHPCQMSPIKLQVLYFNNKP